jgi:hypothetical protein
MVEHLPTNSEPLRSNPTTAKKKKKKKKETREGYHLHGLDFNEFLLHSEWVGSGKKIPRVFPQFPSKDMGKPC